MKAQSQDLINIICNYTREGGDSIISKDVAVLLLVGADPNVCNEKGIPVLHFAAFRGLLLTAYALIKRGADVNAQDADGNTALMAAVIRRNENIVRLLLEAGADKTIMNNECDSPVDVACGSIYRLLNKWNPETSERMFIENDDRETRDYQEEASYEFDDDDEGASSDESLPEDDTDREEHERTRIFNDTTERKDELKALPVKYSEKRNEPSLGNPAIYRDSAAHIDRNPGLYRSRVGEKSRNWYILWALLFPGVHNLYVGNRVRGIIQLLLLFSVTGAMPAWLWAFVEAIVVQRDGTGNEMKEGSFVKVFLLWLLGVCVLGMWLATLSDKGTNDAPSSHSSMRNGINIESYSVRYC